MSSNDRLFTAAEEAGLEQTSVAVAHRADAAAAFEDLAGEALQPFTVAEVDHDATHKVIVGLVGAILPEQNDEKAEGRHYLGLDILPCRLSIVPDNETNEVTTETLPTLTAPLPSEGSLHGFQGLDRVLLACRHLSSGKTHVPTDQKSTHPSAIPPHTR